MARIRRLFIPDSYYYIKGRGCTQIQVFELEHEKLEFLDRLGMMFRRTGGTCLAWALTANDYHLIIRASKLSLTKLMAPLLRGYAADYNLRHQRKCAVFHDRYSSILFDADRYLLELIRYVHLTPLRYRNLDDLSALNRYAWTGHSGLLGRFKQIWHSTDEVLRCYSENIYSARARYRRYVEDGWNSKYMKLDSLGDGITYENVGWKDFKKHFTENISDVQGTKVLGDSEFVNRINVSNINKLHAGSHEQSKRNLETLVDRVCCYCNIDKSQLVGKSRNNSLSIAKGLICFLGTEKLGYSWKEISVLLNITQPAVSYWICRGREYYCGKEIIQDVVSF